MNSMKMIFWPIIFLLLALFVADGLYAHDLVWPGDKLKALVPGAESFEQKNLYVSSAQRRSIEERLGRTLPSEDLKPSVYFSIVRTDPDARPHKTSAVLFIDAYSESGKIEMGVVVSGRGELLKVRLFENSEPRDLNDELFLRQFLGKKTSDSFRVGVDIDAPEGEEESAQAIASGAKRGLVIINEMFGK